MIEVRVEERRKIHSNNVTMILYVHIYLYHISMNTVDHQEKIREN